MNTNVIFRQVEINRLEAGHAAQSGAREELERVIAHKKEKLGESYDQAMREVEENRGARETRSTWMLLGTLIGGFGIGSGLGQACGEGASDGDRSEARTAQRLMNTADFDLRRTNDRLDDAQERLRDQTQHVASVEKLGKEIQDAGWIGIV